MEISRIMCPEITPTLKRGAPEPPNAKSTSKKKLKGLSGNCSSPIPPEYEDDFELIPSPGHGSPAYLDNGDHSDELNCFNSESSGDHGSSTHRDKADQSEDHCSTDSNSSSVSADEEGGDYQQDDAEDMDQFENGGMVSEDSDESMEDGDGEYRPVHARTMQDGSGHVKNMRATRYKPDRTRHSRFDEIAMKEELGALKEEVNDLEEEVGKPANGGRSTRGKKLAAKALGIVRYNEAKELQWFDPVVKEWRAAVYHQEIRKTLIEEVARHGSYKHKLARGKAELDITAFHPAYANNGGDREHWPKILFQYAPTMANFLHSKPVIWQLHDGRVVIDCNNDAMYDYPEIPVTLAKNADCWLLLTCMRLNNHITIQDFRGRMPGDRNPHMADPLGRNRISMNMTRFRKFSCCLTWNSIRNVDSQRMYLDKKLPRRCIRLNSTESFRKLFHWEVAESELQDAGKFLQRTRGKNKDISQESSHRVYKRKREEFEQLKRTFDSANPNGLEDHDTEDEEYAKQQEEKAAVDSEANKKENQCKIEAITEATFVKPGHRKRGAAKDALMLPDHVDPGAGQAQRPICPRRHKDYAGFLTRAPTNVKEAQLLYDLLRPSRIHFHGCTSEEAPKTEADECYICQLADIQDAILVWHESRPRWKSLPPAKIVGLQYVDQGELYWNSGWVDEWYGPQPVVKPEDLF
ncbi:MAG: hypothetical protein Q9166_005654 [cf. Caloplaca sp. 2 TL-2023]